MNRIPLLFKKLYQSLLIIVELFMFITFIWLHFIRERLPEEVPFNLYLNENSIHVLQNKQSLHVFSSHFKQIPNNNLDDPLVFLAWFKDIFDSQPEVNTRAFQLAIEVSYKHKQFSEEHLCEAFGRQISILDLTGRNNSLADTSTFYSFLQTYALLKQLGAAQNIEMRIIISPPLKGSLKDLPPKIMDILREGHKATGNSINDIILNNHYYDYKNTRDICYNKNHIIYLDYSNFDTCNLAQSYLLNLSKRFQKILDDHVDYNQKPVSKEVYVYATKLSYTINDLIRDNSMNISEKIIQWNALLFQTWDVRPTDFYYPLIIATTDKPFHPNPAFAEDVKQIKLPISKVLRLKDVYAQSTGTTLTVPQTITVPSRGYASAHGGRLKKMQVH